MSRMSRAPSPVAAQQAHSSWPPGRPYLSQNVRSGRWIRVGTMADCYVNLIPGGLFLMFRRLLRKRGCDCAFFLPRGSRPPSPEVVCTSLCFVYCACVSYQPTPYRKAAVCSQWKAGLFFFCLARAALPHKKVFILFWTPGTRCRLSVGSIVSFLFCVCVRVDFHDSEGTMSLVYSLWGESFDSLAQLLRSFASNQGRLLILKNHVVCFRHDGSLRNREVYCRPNLRTLQ